MCCHRRTSPFTTAALSIPAVACAVALLVPTLQARALAQPDDRVLEVTVSPTSATVFVKQQQRLTVQVRYKDGKDLKLPAAWKLTGEIGAVDQSGLLTAGPKRASGTVTVTLGGKSATAQVSVVPYGYGVWHAAGKIVYSVQDGGDSEYDLCIMAADGSGPVNLTPNPADPPETWNVVLNEGRHGCWNPDGTLIVFEGLGPDGAVTLCLMNADGSGRRVLKQDARARYLRPTFSTDGTRVLFDAKPIVTAGETGPGDIWVMGLDGTQPTRLTSDPADEQDACWSPDGTQIAYVKDRDSPAGPVGEIWVMRADGTNARRLSPAGDVRYEHPAWSPDAALIACTAHDLTGPVGDIVLIPADGGGPVNLTNTPEIDEYGPAWSWDGTEVLFATTDAPGLVREIWIVTAKPGSTPRNLTNRPDQGNYIRWFSYRD